MVKIYGSSDDLVCLDNSNYAEDEICCYDVAGVWLFLDDDTVLFVAYSHGIWRISIEQEGTMPYQHIVCPEILHLFRAGQHHSAVQKTLVGDALPKPVLRYDWHFQS